MIEDLTIKGIAGGFSQKKYKPTEVVEECLKRIRLVNGDLNAYLTVIEEEVMARAAEADQRQAEGKMLSILDGVPGGVKDIFNTKGVRSSCASKMLDNFVPPYNATAVDRLEAAGMLMLGKTNTDEFACGGSTEYSAFGVTRNPWDLERVAGGSSGGSAAAVAAGLGCFALGSDTGGSIRQPAAFCGVTGLKPTYGRVSRSGVTAMASSLDTIGAFTRSVEDMALMLQLMAGKDVKDSTTPAVEVPDYVAGMEEFEMKGKRIGVPKEYFIEGVDKEVVAKVKEAIKWFEGQGAEVKEVSLPRTKYAVAVYYIVMPAELSTNLSRFDGIRFGLKPEGEMKGLIDQYYLTRDQGFGDEVKRRILTGTYVLSAGYFEAFYAKAQKVRTLIIEDFAKVFEEVDVLMTPVAPTAAFKIGENTDDPLKMYLQDAFTIPASVAGLCGMSIPCGFNAEGLPVGLQMIGPQFAEASLFGFGYAYQRETDWHLRKPGIVA